MKNHWPLRLATALLCAGMSATLVAAPDVAPSTSSDPMLLLPLGSRHVFQRALSSWSVKVEYWKPYGHGFITVEHPTPEDFKHDWRNVLFFENASEKDPNNFRKKMFYRPDGRLVEETDWNVTEGFFRQLRLDGTVALYLHSLGRKDIAGYSLSPDKKTVSHFADGNGDLIEWDDEAGKFTHIWYHDGQFYLVKEYRKGRCDSTQLRVDNDAELDSSSLEENLDLYSQHEFWFKNPNQPIRAQVNDSYSDQTGTIVPYHFTDDEVKKRIREQDNSRIPLEQKDKAIQQQLEADYLLRRAAFITSYEQVLKSAGQSWQSLGLESLGSPPQS